MYTYGEILEETRRVVRVVAFLDLSALNIFFTLYVCYFFTEEK